MSGILGYVGRDPAGQAAARASAMDRAMAHWGPDGHDLWTDGVCALGQRLRFNTPEALHERMPRWVPDARIALTAAARLDNRDELLATLGVPGPERDTIADGDLILHAYLRWGETTPEHLLGDWSFAAWHPDERRLFLARDHHGITSLCFWEDGKRFAFASDPLALYAAGAPRRLNELYLAQVLVSWPAYHGSQTVDLDIRRLPPAHAMTVTPTGIRTWRFWQLEDTPELHRARPEDYVEELLTIYDEAVRCRLRSYRPVGVTLSGGLDSGSVTALAARALAEQGKPLTALTAVPLYGVADVRGSFGDESALAAATAARWPNVEHRLLGSETVSPLEGIRRTLGAIPEPVHAAANAFWITDLLEHARMWGIGTLLTGQAGNATISWTGAPRLRSHRAALARGDWKTLLRRSLPPTLLRTLMHRFGHRRRWDHTAIHPDFAARLELDRRLIDGIGRDLTLRASWKTPRDCRLALLQPGASRLGDLWGRKGAAAGLEVRDPTLDKRVLTYTMAMPDTVFDARGATDRWVIRAAMQSLLPDTVRLNRRRGRQSADLAHRLAAHQAEMHAALDSIAAGPAQQYLDIDNMRGVWAAVLTEKTSSNTHRAGTILLRGLMAGWFLNSRA